MSDVLILNQPQVSIGLVTKTFTIPATGQYNVKFTGTFPFAQPNNSSPGGPGVGVGVGGTFGAGSGMGLGTGNGGGGEGFTAGDQGTGKGNPGQGFGAGNSYQQPPAAGSNANANSATVSGLSIVVNKNAVAQYTSTAPTGIQSGLSFVFAFQANANDTITVVLTGTAGLDDALEAVKSTISINQGLF